MPAIRTLLVTLACVVVSGIAPLVFPTSASTVALVAVATGAVPAVLDFRSERRRKAAPGGGAPYGARQTSSGGAFALVLVVILVVMGGLAYGVSYGVGWVTGHERVTADRLSAPVQGRAGDLRVVVRSVGITSHYTKVEVSLRNTGSTPLTIPRFDNVQLIDERGTVQPLFDLGDTSPINVPTGGVAVTQVLTFRGHPSATARSLTLDVSNLFWQGFGQPQSLSVKKISLRQM